MTKRELIQRLADKLDVSQKEAKVIVDTILEEMEEALVRGERIEIRGFGTFSIREYEGYKGRNPKTGEVIDIPPKRLPHFRVGKETKDRINRPPEGQEKSQ